MKFGFNRLVVSEEKMFENVAIHTYIHTHIRTTEAYLSYKLTTEPKGSGELNIELKRENGTKQIGEPVHSCSLASCTKYRELNLEET